MTSQEQLRLTRHERRGYLLRVKYAQRQVEREPTPDNYRRLRRMVSAYRRARLAVRSLVVLLKRRMPQKG